MASWNPKVDILELETKLVAAIIEMGINCDIDFAIEVASRIHNTSSSLKSFLNIQKECSVNLLDDNEDDY
jgi:hypothetical protein